MTLSDLRTKLHKNAEIQTMDRVLGTQQQILLAVMISFLDVKDWKKGFQMSYN